MKTLCRALIITKTVGNVAAEKVKFLNLAAKFDLAD
jgi:hypothetical protein